MNHDQPDLNRQNFGNGYYPPGHYPYINMIPPDKLIPNDIHIVHIAHNLSLINRFAGAIPYSVAEHCLLCSSMVQQLVPELDPTKLATLQLCALLHDAHEAYIGDIIKPVADILGDAFKQQLRKLKHFIDVQIAAAVGLLAIQVTAVGIIDKRILDFELWHFFNIESVKHVEESRMYQTIRNEFICYPPAEAEAHYLAAYYDLMAVWAQEDDTEAVTV